MTLEYVDYGNENFMLERDTCTLLKNNKQQICKVCDLNNPHWDKYKLHCGHHFHTRCLRKWFHEKGDKLDCPRCGYIGDGHDEWLELRALEKRMHTRIRMKWSDDSPEDGYTRYKSTRTDAKGIDHHEYNIVSDGGRISHRQVIVANRKFSGSCREDIDGSVNDICIMCCKWCTDNSRCSDRFMWIQGYFKDSDDIHCVALCDSCMDIFEMYSEEIDIEFEDGGVFVVDAIHRETN